MWGYHKNISFHILSLLSHDFSSLDPLHQGRINTKWIGFHPLIHDALPSNIHPQKHTHFCTQFTYILTPHFFMNKFLYTNAHSNSLGCIYKQSIHALTLIIVLHFMHVKPYWELLAIQKPYWTWLPIVKQHHALRSL